MSKTYLGANMERLGTPAPFAPYSKVIVWYDDEHAFMAGDDSGRTLEADCPFATQAIADKMLAAVQGYAYQPYEAEGAILDPAAELGDGVTVNGTYSVLGRIERTFNALCVADVAAPADEEIDHEMPYENQTQRALKRKMTLGRNYYGVQVTKNAGWEVVKYNADGEEIKRARFNADELAMYDDQGNPRIYFDTNTARYKYVGDLDISGGNINLSGGSITWGDNLPETGIDEDTARTLINAELVSSPTIAGGQFMDIDRTNWLEMGQGAGDNIGYLYHYYSAFSESEPVCAMGYYGDPGIKDSWVLAPFRYIILEYSKSLELTAPIGDWDWRYANIVGPLKSDSSLTFSAYNGNTMLTMGENQFTFKIGETTWILNEDGLSKQ